MGATRGRVLCCGLAISLLLGAGEASAHRPHDDVHAIALPPSFASTGEVLISVVSAAKPRRVVPARSFDTGFSWERLTHGVDARSDVESFCVSPNYDTDGVFLFATLQDGVYRTTDFGGSFQPVNAGLVSKDITHSACALDDLGNLVLFVSHAAGGVSRTDDLGQTWSLVLPTTVVVDSLAVSPELATDGVVLAADSTGAVHGSLDWGQSFNLERQVTPPSDIRQLTIPPGFPGGQIRYLTTLSSGVLRSTDFGLTYQSVSACLPAVPMENIAATPTFAVDQTLFATAQTSGVYKSTDAGGCWTHYDIPLQAPPGHGPKNYNALAISPSYGTDQTVYVGMLDGLFRSNDGGQSWFEYDTAGPANFERIAVSPAYASDQTVAVARYGAGISRTTNATTTWTPANKGITTSFTRDIVFSPAYGTDRTMFTGIDLYVPKSNTQTISWNLGTTIGPDVPTTIELSPGFANDRTMFVGTRSTGIFRSTNGGLNWTKVYAMGRWVYELAMSPSYPTDKTVFAGFPSGSPKQLLKSVNGGTVWTPSGSGLPGDTRGPDVVFSPGYATDQTLFAGTLYGLYRSLDGGTTWTVMPIANLPTDANIASFDISPAFVTDGTMIVSVQGAGLYRSTDWGMSFVQVSPALRQAQHELGWLAFSPAFAADGTIYGASQDRLFRSTDGGVGWSEVNRGPIRYECDEATHCKQTGTWPRVVVTGASTNKYIETTTTNDRVDFHFVGTKATWIGAGGPDFGRAKVYVDGVLKTTVDQYSATSKVMTNTYVAQGLTPGVHTLSVVAAGVKNAASTGYRVVVDAFDVE